MYVVADWFSLFCFVVVFEGLTSCILLFSFCHISHSELLQSFKPPAVMNVFLTNLPAYLFVQLLILQAVLTTPVGIISSLQKKLDPWEVKRLAYSHRAHRKRTRSFPSQFGALASTLLFTCKFILCVSFSRVLRSCLSLTSAAIAHSLGLFCLVFGLSFGSFPGTRLWFWLTTWVLESDPWAGALLLASCADSPCPTFLICKTAIVTGPSSQDCFEDIMVAKCSVLCHTLNKC